MSEASGAGDDGAQSALGSEGDEGEDLLDNAQACVVRRWRCRLDGVMHICCSADSKLPVGEGIKKATQYRHNIRVHLE